MPFTKKQGSGSVTLDIQGRNLPDLFTEGARAYFSLVRHIDSMKDDERVKVVVDAKDLSSLFDTWISELREREKIHNVLFGEFRVASIQKVSANQYVLTGEAFGESGNADDGKSIGLAKNITITEGKSSAQTPLFLCSCNVKV
ncbi:archease [Candidatus Uhrbacteria bacterium]|nr:archease [Candidatus Uhrbacteria bacterium]